MDVFSRIHIPRSGKKFLRSVIKRTTIVWQSTAFFVVAHRGTEKVVSNRGANTQQRRVHGGGEQEWWAGGAAISVPEAGGPCQPRLWLSSLGLVSSFIGVHVKFLWISFLG